MQYIPLAIANSLISLGERRTPMGLVKLVYLAQGWGLARGVDFCAELPEVWRYGPVHRSLYDALNVYGHSVIAAPVTPPGRPTPAVDARDQHILDLLKEVSAAYATLSELDLSSICHAPGTPWKQVAEENGFRVRVGTTIPAWMLANHYAARLARRAA